jgi:DNA-binding PadR family transcriptional regulator
LKGVKELPKKDYYVQGQLTDVAYLVLVSLVTPRHGYLVMNRIEEMTGGSAVIGPASLYTTLKKLTQANFIRLLDDTDNKKVYGITDVGRETLRVEIEKREQYAMYGRQAIKEKTDSLEELA